MSIIFSIYRNHARAKTPPRKAAGFIVQCVRQDSEPVTFDSGGQRHEQVLACLRLLDLPAGLLITFERKGRGTGCTLLNPPGSPRGCQQIRADARVHTTLNVLFRFHVHAPGKPLSVFDRETEVKDAVSRLCSLRSLSAPHV